MSFGGGIGRGSVCPDSAGSRSKGVFAMPFVRIEVRAGRSPSDKKALLDAVHKALVEALRIPDDARTQGLY